MSTFPDGVFFDAVLPLQWQQETDWQPLEVARYLDVLADFEVTERPDIVAAHEAKLDLQLVWLARLMTPVLPSPAHVTIGIESVRWQGVDGRVGERGCLAIAPGTALIHLLRLPAEIVAVEPSPQGSIVTARWCFDHLGARDAFERYVFRRHREQIRQEKGDQP
ncbi:hypothetical protein JHS3_09310 [Jeongeupia sp. HS-3]|uniref:hypothetical protein n=1 Tax=Jeongeupia sp. HS-3 TaxID=1009682 RepID=UPI0018A347BC|nr:hypothetical protein [Jeongeupia sp. HS-3]BCL75195.1 hypothetical protein JHS3_09310 [Jeongeupia sp. HS-3]